MASELCIEEVSLSAVAERFGTPTYVYSEELLKTSFDKYQSAFLASPFSTLICVAVKANSNLSLLKLLSDEGAGFDIVSSGELKRVLAAGGKAERVVFSGVGKSDEEIRFALQSGIRMLNVESAQELERIDAIAGELQIQAPVALRVNPDIDAGTHPYLATGLKEHKFGIGLEEARELYLKKDVLNNISYVGLSCHLGSMISELSVFEEAFSILRPFIDDLKNHGVEIQHLDCGGGLAVCYKDEAVPDFHQFAQIIQTHFSGLDCEIILEPGRTIFADAGVLLTKVLFVKENDEKKFVIVDAAMNDLLRPALYGAYHAVEPVNSSQSGSEEVVDIVGPICESGDFIAEGHLLPAVEQGELLAIRSAGAYGFTMASNYNSRPRAAEVLICGDKARCIRERETEEALFEAEKAALEVCR